MNEKEQDQLDEIKVLQKRIAVLEELNARYKDMEQKITEARAYAENILGAMKNPLIIMDGDLKIFSANEAFYKTFKVNPGETAGRFIYDLGNRQWDIPKLRQLLTEITTEKDALDDYEIEHDFNTIGRKIMLLSARRVPPTPEKPRIILLAIEDITEHRKMEGEEEKNKQLDAINQRLEGKVAELEILNKAAIDRELKMVGLKKEVEELRKKIL